MDSRSRTLLRSILVAYVALIAASILVDDPLIATAADLGFAAVAGFFGYLVYANRSPSDDPRVLWITTGALVASGIAQLLALVPGFGIAAVVSTLLFVVGFIGYFALRRGWA